MLPPHPQFGNHKYVQQYCSGLLNKCQQVGLLSTYYISVGSIESQRWENITLTQSKCLSFERILSYRPKRVLTISVADFLYIWQSCHIFLIDHFLLSYWDTTYLGLHFHPTHGSAFPCLRVLHGSRQYSKAIASLCSPSVPPLPHLSRPTPSWSWLCCSESWAEGTSAWAWPWCQERSLAALARLWFVICKSQFVIAFSVMFTGRKC